MAKSLDQFRQELALRVQDAAAKLSQEARDAMIAQAILQRYSKDRPAEKVSDVDGNGTASLATPAGFEDGFSIVRSVEYPIGKVPPALLEDEGWMMYRTPTALQILLTSARPAASEKLRVTWTARHNADGSTVPEPDFEAVCDYAAALAFEALAAIHAQTGDSTLMADAVNYRTKSQEYLGLAKAARKRYFDHIGVSEDRAGSPAGGPAMSIGDLDQLMGSGVDRMTHPKGSR